MYKFIDEDVYIPNIDLTKYVKLTTGLLVVDVTENFFETESDSIGIVKECTDLHNVIVEFPRENCNLYCMFENCTDMYDENLRFVDK